MKPGSGGSFNSGSRFNSEMSTDNTQKLRRSGSNQMATSQGWEAPFNYQSPQDSTSGEPAIAYARDDHPPIEKVRPKDANIDGPTWEARVNRSLDRMPDFAGGDTLTKELQKEKRRSNQVI